MKFRPVSLIFNTFLVCVVFTAIVLVVVVYRGLKHVHRQTAMRQMLLNVDIALSEYFEAHGHYPPLVQTRNGHSHSWRSFLVKDQPIDLNSAWDSSINESACPTPQHFGIFAITGSGTAWESGRLCEDSEITDGTHKTIIAIAIDDVSDSWMKPVDLHFDGRKVTLEGREIELNGCLVLLANGDVRFLGQIPIRQLIPHLTIDRDDGGSVFR